MKLALSALALGTAISIAGYLVSATLTESFGQLTMVLAAYGLIVRGRA